MWSRANLAGLLAFLALAAAAPLLPAWLISLATIAFANALVVLGLVILWRTGLVPFGWALYYATGAYAVALLQELCHRTPCGPVGPAGPAPPCGPLSPCGPAGPAAPTEPAGPVAPAGPVPADPVGPAAPAGPVGPIGPAAPAAPVGPGGPLTLGTMPGASEM